MKESKKTILIVDDEENNIELLAEVLSESYNIKVSYNGQQALNILEKSYKEIDLILLDIHMPEFDGYEVARHIQEDSKLSSIPFVFLTASSDNDSVLKGFELGAKDYVTKPINTKELKVRVDNHVKTYTLQKELTEQKEEFFQIFNTSKDGIAILDLDTNFLLFNDAYLNMTGFTKDELLQKSCAGLFAPEDLLRAKEALKEVMEKGFVENFQKTCIVKDGKRLKVNISFSLMPDKKRILLAAKDVTETKEKEKQIKEYIKLVDKNIITSSTDIHGNITYTSEAFCEISGYSKEELIGKNHRIIRHPDMPEKIYEDLWSTITKNKTWEGEIKNLKKDKTHYWVKASISPVFNDDGEKVGYTAIRQDITDKKQIELISITDGLTNIFNRRHFTDMFPKSINSAKRKDELISFLIMDIDHFKQYNDTYGHQMGDDVLIKVAECIKDSLLRADDLCFRLGGEEFGVIFRTDSKNKAIEFADVIRQNIENLHIEHSKNSASSYVTMSMGLMCKNANDIKSEDELYKDADDLLYEAKESGRNRVITNS